LVIRAGAGLEDVLRADGRLVLEREALPAYLPKRRWFASKGEKLQAVRIAYAVMLPGTAGTVMFAEVEAVLPGRTERYVLPLGLAWEDETTGALPQQLALTRIRRGPRVGYLTDAFAVDALTRGMIEGLRDSRVVSLGEEGELQFRPTSRMASLELPPDAEIRRLSAEQSNSSWIVGDAIVLKLVRRVLAGIHPEGEMTRFLTERGFGNTAPLFGELVRVDRAGVPHTVGLAQGFVRNQGDGWSWTLDFLARQVEELALTGAAERPDGVAAGQDTFEAYEVFARAIGTRLAELHAVLSQPTEEPDFTPEPASDAVLDEWGEGAIEQIGAAIGLLAKSCAMRDVAGLLRSFDYAAAAAAPGRVAASEQAALRRQTALQEFKVRASSTFLEAYRTVLEAANSRWVPIEAEAPLLDLFLLEKAAYEIKYEAANRPTWIGIPLAGMHGIAERLLGLEA
jgi:maltose alpha-D-glucosyltransferase/alpha-amylase